MTANHPGCGWVGPCHCDTDNRPCRCGHKSITHGSYTKQSFVGIGNGPCGHCNCERLEP